MLVFTGKPHLHFCAEVETVLPHLEHFVRIIYPHFSQTDVSPKEWQLGHSRAKTLWQYGHTVILSEIVL